MLLLLLFSFQYLPSRRLTYLILCIFMLWFIVDVIVMHNHWNQSEDETSDGESPEKRHAHRHHVRQARNWQIPSARETFCFILSTHCVVVYYSLNNLPTINLLLV